MGVTLHTSLHIEYKGRESILWQHFAKKKLGYDSRLFSQFNRKDPFSNLHKELQHLRGVPEDATYRTLRDYTLIVDDQRRHPESIPNEQAQWLVEGLISVPVKADRLKRYESLGITFISKPEWQYAHWLSHIEFLSLLIAVFGYKHLNDKAKLGMWWDIKDTLNFHDRSGRDTRIIFWFSSRRYNDSLRNAFLHLRYPPHYGDR